MQESVILQTQWPFPISQGCSCQAEHFASSCFTVNQDLPFIPYRIPERWKPKFKSLRKEANLPSQWTESSLADLGCLVACTREGNSSPVPLCDICLIRSAQTREHSPPHAQRALQEQCTQPTGQSGRICTGCLRRRRGDAANQHIPNSPWSPRPCCGDRGFYSSGHKWWQEAQEPLFCCDNILSCVTAVTVFFSPLHWEWEQSILLTALQDLHARKLHVLSFSLPLSLPFTHTQQLSPPPFHLSRVPALKLGSTSALQATPAHHTRLCSDSQQRKFQLKGWDKKYLAQ